MEIVLAIVIAAAGIAVLELVLKPPCCPHEGELHLDGESRENGSPVRLSARELAFFVAPMLLAAAAACVFFVSIYGALALAVPAVLLFTLGRRTPKRNSGGSRT